MWRKDKVWMHYLNDIISADVATAVFLSSFMRHLSRTGNHAHTLEVMDVQRYRVIRKPARVRATLHSRLQVPFVFVVGKN